ncbi:phosphonoacetate hydrolase [Apiospora phragmitis]|uniref:Phosphonoacetate hydrolase n=1 Tax=Apiospora phragmitis TaxID=2905665 RepID=A0ABR1X698_9PEZI
MSSENYVTQSAADNNTEGHITLHGKTYKLPRQPTVVVCVDGFDPTYLDQGIADGVVPTMQRFAEHGFHATADAAMPTFTNPNNVSIITGAPTAVHGIAGNYFLDRATGEEVMVVDDSLLRGSTILAEMAGRGVRVAAITAKDKLRRILEHRLAESSICWSSQCASEDVLAWLGKGEREDTAAPKPPSQYSAELSLLVLDAGVKILEERRADLLYLTLSDWVQHKHAPGSPAANEFMSAIDARLKRLVDLGAVVAVTGDHGMNDKCDSGGSPNILFAQDELEEKFGQGCPRAICPITDPFVKYHGHWGLHVAKEHTADVENMIRFCRDFGQVDMVLAKEEAARVFEMPEDREGDFVIVSKKNAVVGSKAVEHDLSSLQGHRLHSHGGLSEQKVPLMMSQPIQFSEALLTKRWRNFDIFDLILNHGQ